MPAKWAQMFGMLPNHSVGSPRRKKPGLPLILGAWQYHTHAERHEQFVTHIEYAAEADCLDAVDAFLRNLAPDDWYATWARKFAPWERI